MALLPPHPGGKGDPRRQSGAAQGGGLQSEPIASGTPRATRGRGTHTFGGGEEEVPPLRRGGAVRGGRGPVVPGAARRARPTGHVALRHRSPIYRGAGALSPQFRARRHRSRTVREEPRMGNRDPGSVGGGGLRGAAGRDRRRERPPRRLLCAVQSGTAGLPGWGEDFGQRGSRVWGGCRGRGAPPEPVRCTYCPEGTGPGAARRRSHVVPIPEHPRLWGLPLSRSPRLWGIRIPTHPHPIPGTQQSSHAPNPPGVPLCLLAAVPTLSPVPPCPAPSPPPPFSLKMAGLGAGEQAAKWLGALRHPPRGAAPLGAYAT